ncbi:MAG: helix-turn-helix domain-containing protein [Tumebacillaceae bacterium]
MKRKHWSPTDLAKHTGVHKSEISRIFNHKQHLSLHILDAFTLAFGVAEDTLYPYYVEECFNENQHIDKRRSEQFLYKCAANGYEKPLLALLDAMVEEKSKTIRNKNYTYIFNVAEKLFAEQLEQQALPLYEFIIENMPDRFSEQVAISYFRKFYLVRLTSLSEHAMVQVIEHLAYMPQEFKAHAYLWITATFYMWQDWREAYKAAVKLEHLATEAEHTGRALVFQSLALSRLNGTLDEVLQVTDRYAQVNDYYANLAVGNRMIAYLDFGHYEYVDAYLAWLEDRDDMYLGIGQVLETFVKLKRFEDAERLLFQFEDVIREMEVGNLNKPLLPQKYLHFLYAHALLQLESGRVATGLDEILHVAQLAKELGTKERFKQCVRAIWTYRAHVTPEQEENYLNLLNTGRFK